MKRRCYIHPLKRQPVNPLTLGESYFQRCLRVYAESTPEQKAQYDAIVRAMHEQLDTGMFDGLTSRYVP